ncbi:MAG: hypothetical protein KatS3mg004_3036 [Bryobacteraceae bacterium]|jgi:hypothetical protein|nr:MAG: hypothetical protein KatS3mg004_3036 [Bryobacteraceae bacterium]
MNAPSLELALIELHYPGLPPTVAGLVVFDQATGRTQWRFRRDWTLVGDEVDRFVLEGVEDLVRAIEAEHGPQQCLKLIEEQWSNTLRLSTRLAFGSADADLSGCADALAAILLGHD